MTTKKRLISVAAAAVLCTVTATADYLPLTSSAAEDKWVMFGVAGFHANGATTVEGTEAGMFTVPDETENLAQDTGGDELYGYEEGVSANTDDAITDGASNVLAAVKRVDGVNSPVYVRVRVADNANINFYEEDPVRTIYVMREDDSEPIFAFSYKAILEGQTLEFSTTTAGATDEAYRVTINSENTYNNPAVAEYIPAVPASSDDGAYLTEISDVLDYDFFDGPQGPNPLNSAKYLQVDHRDIAASGEYTRMYSYDPQNAWLLYDSRNVQQQFNTLEKGKGYWGLMDLAAATPAGLVLGNPSITTQDYLDSGIAEGWNLLAFNADSADLRVATTGLRIDNADGDISISDVSGNHTLTITLAGGGDAVVDSLNINNAIKQAKTNGTMPKTFNVIAIPTGAAELALISDKKFTLDSTVAGIVNTATTLAGQTPLDATTLVDSLAAGNAIISKYGEYALVVKPENTTYAVVDIKCDSAATAPIAPTVAAIGGSACVGDAHDLDLSFDVGATANEAILIASTEPFEVRDHTFTRVFDYKVTKEAGEITALNADTTFPAGNETASFTSAVAETQTLTITADDADENDEILVVTYGTDAGGSTGSVSITFPASVDMTNATEVAAAVATFLNADAGFSAVARAEAAAAVVTLTYDTDTTVGIDINAVVSAAVGGTGTYGTLAGVGAQTVAGSQLTATAAVAAIETSEPNFDDTAGTGNITAIGTQILFRTKAANENEFRIVETGAGDNLTPSTTTDAWAKGSVSDVWSPNNLVQTELDNYIQHTFTDADAVTAESVIDFDFDIDTYTGVTVTLDTFTMDAANVADSTAVYANLQSHINAELNDKNIDAEVAITGVNGGTDFDAILTFTGPDILAVDITLTNATATTTTAVAAPTAEALGLPSFGSGDITQDLKYNFILSPNYVLDGPLYEMKEAGFTAKAMVTGTVNLTNSQINWHSVDLSRKPSEWLDSQDYNLFRVDEQSGYWTYLETAEENPLTFDSANFVANYTQHFDQDGNTYNEVGGGININVYGIDYDFDGTESARVVAIVGGSQIELSRQAGDTYTGQISSHELKEMVEGKEYDIQVVVADGIGYRIPATSSGVVVDYKKPATPDVTITRGQMEITENADDGVEKYYLFSGEIPAVNTAQAADEIFTGTSLNLCTIYQDKTNTYDLKLIALDGDGLTSANASDAFTLDDYVSIFSNAAIITDGNDGTEDQNALISSIATEYYSTTCESGDIATDFPGTSDINAISAAAWTAGTTVKVAYTPVEVTGGTSWSVFVDGGDSNGQVALINYNPNLAGQTVFVQLGDMLYSYVLPGDIHATNTAANPVDLSTFGTPLPGQSLDAE
jgi:hypothetical protein